MAGVENIIHMIKTEHISGYLYQYVNNNMILPVPIQYMCTIMQHSMLTD